MDLLARVRLKSGEKALLLIHLEVQAGPIGEELRIRMFRYRIRLYEKHPGHTILSCAILLDRETGPDTETFRSGGLGDELTFRFPVVNLAQWRHRLPLLEAVAPTNPFAVIVLAHLEYRATQPDATRMASKLRLARSLAKWGYDAEARSKLFILVDSLLVLPEPLEERFNDTLEQTGDPDMMQQLNSLQRVRLRRAQAASLEEGLRRGQLEGQREGAAAMLQTLLQRKFDVLPDWAATHIAQANAETLQQWALRVLEAEKIEDVFSA